MSIKDYDVNDPQSILSYAKKLLHKSLRAVVDNDVIKKIGDNPSGKGGYGTILEKYYFGYEPNSSSKADFESAGLELKSSPIKILKSGKKVSKERLVLNIINFINIIDEEWETSSFLDKNKKLLLFFYVYEEQKVFWDYLIELVNTWSFPEKDFLIIKQDWHTIQDKIKLGKAHELSEGDTLYLGACTKGHKGDNLRKQPKSPIMAKQRAFSLKSSYVNKIIEQLTNKVDQDEEIFKDNKILAVESFEDYIIQQFTNYIGLSPQQIANKLGVTLNSKAKQYLAKLARQILGIKGNKIEEFEKANITMKAIRLEPNDIPKESISFPTFKYTEIVQQDWEDSDILQMMDKKFFFVIFQFDNNKILYLKKVMFWNIPYSHLDIDVRRVFNETKARIMNGNIEHLPRIKENLVSHVRPHGKNKNDTYEAPDGKQYTKKCFWLNAKYIASQIKDNS